MSGLIYFVNVLHFAESLLVRYFIIDLTFFIKLYISLQRQSLPDTNGINILNFLISGNHFYHRGRHNITYNEARCTSAGRGLRTIDIGHGHLGCCVLQYFNCALVLEVKYLWISVLVFVAINVIIPSFPHTSLHCLVLCEVPQSTLH